MTYLPTLLAVLAVALVLAALVAVAAGQTLVAGVCLLATTLTIYLRETRA